MCETAARQLGEVQAARARQLLEIQNVEQLHATANFERGLRMAEDRAQLEAQFGQEEFDLTSRQRKEVDEEKLRIIERSSSLKMLQTAEKQLAEEKALRASQHVKAAQQAKRQKAAQKQARKLYKARASASYADFISSIHLEDADAVDAIFSETSSLLGRGVFGARLGSSVGSGSEGKAPGGGQGGDKAASSSQSSDIADEAYALRLEKLRAEEAAAVAARQKREEGEKKAMLEAQKHDFEALIAKDHETLAALQTKHAQELRELREKQAKEKVSEEAGKLEERRPGEHTLTVVDNTSSRL